MSGGSFTIGGVEVEPDEVEPTEGAIDHTATMASLLVQQFRQPANLDLVGYLAAEFQELENALWDLFTKRGIDSATDDALDMIGVRVGQRRNGYGDDDYRRFIRARIAANRSSGTRAQLITITRLVIDDPDLTVKLRNETTATVVVNVGGVLAGSTAEILLSFLIPAVAAGVRVILEYETEDTLFAFDDDPEGAGFPTDGDPGSGGALAEAVD